MSAIPNVIPDLTIHHRFPNLWRFLTFYAFLTKQTVDLTRMVGR